MNSSTNYVSEFIAESARQMSEIEMILPLVADYIKKDETPPVKEVSRLFRAIHSIKGGSSFAGLDEIETVFLKLEEILSRIVESGRTALEESEDLVDRIFSFLEESLHNQGKIKKREWKKIEKDAESFLLKSFPKKTPAETPADIEYDNSEKMEELNKPDSFEIFENEEESEEESEEEGTGTNKYVSFKIGTEHYAVPIEYVYDMKEMLPCSSIPNQKPHFLGVANLRGSVIPVIDLRKVFGFNEITYNEFTVFLMLKVKGKIKGCVVDSIDDVVSLESENTQSTPVLSRKIKTDFVKYVAKEPKSERFLIVIDVEKMLENE
jgi:purine-binding chemotaxis protein CheW